MEIRQIDKSDLLANKNMLIALLFENLTINFVGKEGLLELAEEKYNDALQFCEDGTAIFIGAFEKDFLCGFLWAYIRTILREQRVHITQLIVHSELRKKGVGKLLLLELDAYAIANKVNTIELLTSVENDNAISFYENSGYRISRVQMEKRA